MAVRRRSAPKPDIEVAEAEVAEAPAPRGRVVRESAHRWWCPKCDRAHQPTATVCDGCGFSR